MTPPRSSESRLSLVEAEVKASLAESRATAAELSLIKSTQNSNHRENRDSIHDLKSGQQTLIDQNSFAQQDITKLKTQMDMVIGTDHGKKGRLDEISESIKNVSIEFKSQGEAFLEKLEETASKQSSQNWMYELGKVIVFGGVAAAAAHFSR